MFLRAAASTITVGIIIGLVRGAIFLLNQPSDLAFIGGLALLPLIAGSLMWALQRIWRIE
jgi:hypothetical protein